MRLFVHIGYPKTATTWLQRSVFPGHPGLAYWDRFEHDWILELVTCHDLDFDVGYFRRQCQGSVVPGSPSKMVISWERLSGDPYHGGQDSARNAHRLHSVFPEARVVVCVRSQADMINSLYRQYVHQGGACNLQRFLELRFPSPVFFSLDHLKYDRLVGLYQELFGADSVFVALYERLRRSPERFLDDLFSFMEVDASALDADALTRGWNRGMSPPSLWIARFLNRFLFGLYNPAPIIPSRRGVVVMRRVLQNYLDPLLFDRVARRKSAVGPDLRSSLENHYRDSNRALMEITGLSLDRYGYPL